MSPQERELLPLRFGPREWLGALGDLGTFLPIYLALVTLNGMPPAPALALAGATYIASSLFFRIPMPVQPLKAMAAIAVAHRLGAPMISSAGLWMGAILLTLALTRRVEWLARYFTAPIIKGIQLGVGLMLLKAGFTLMASGPARGIPAVPGGAPFGAIGFLSVLWLLVLPQLPLTLGNAVYAVSDVAHVYFGGHASRATPLRIALSLGLANLTAGALGGIPVCHGSGGMTAHYRFGARTAGATIITGGLFLLIAAVFARRAPELLGRIPHPLLGAMVVYVGLCHALLVLRLKDQRLLAYAIGLLGGLTGNLAYALAFGLIAERARRRFGSAPRRGVVLPARAENGLGLRGGT